MLFDVDRPVLVELRRGGVRDARRPHHGQDGVVRVHVPDQVAVGLVIGRAREDLQRVARRAALLRAPRLEL